MQRSPSMAHRDLHPSPQATYRDLHPSPQMTYRDVHLSPQMTYREPRLTRQAASRDAQSSPQLLFRDVQQQQQQPQLPQLASPQLTCRDKLTSPQMVYREKLASPKMTCREVPSSPKLASSELLRVARPLATSQQVGSPTQKARETRHRKSDRKLTGAGGVGATEPPLSLRVSTREVPRVPLQLRSSQPPCASTLGGAMLDDAAVCSRLSVGKDSSSHSTPSRATRLPNSWQPPMTEESGREGSPSATPRLKPSSPSRQPPVTKSDASSYKASLQAGHWLSQLSSLSEACRAGVRGGSLQPAVRSHPALSSRAASPDDASRLSRPASPRSSTTRLTLSARLSSLVKDRQPQASLASPQKVSRQLQHSVALTPRPPSRRDGSVAARGVQQQPCEQLQPSASLRTLWPTSTPSQHMLAPAQRNAGGTSSTAALAAAAAAAAAATGGSGPVATAAAAGVAAAQHQQQHQQQMRPPASPPQLPRSPQLGTATRSAAASAASSAAAPSTKRGQAHQPRGRQQQQQRLERRRWSAVGWSPLGVGRGRPETLVEDELSDVCLRLQLKLRMLRQDSIAAGDDADDISLVVPL